METTQALSAPSDRANDEGEAPKGGVPPAASPPADGERGQQGEGLRAEETPAAAHKVPSGITPSMVKRLEGPTVTSMTYAEERKEEAKIISIARKHAPQPVSRRKTRGASDLMSMRRVCRRLHDLMGTVPFWIEMCRHRYGFFEVRNERIQEEVAVLEEEKAAEREKAQLEAKAIEEEKERRKVLRELRAKKRELQRRAAAEEQAEREKQAAAAAEMTQHQSQSGEQESQPSVPTATATPETSSGSTEPPRIDPNDPAFPDALIRTGSVSEPPEPDDDEETTEVDADEAAIPSQIVAAYSHSRIVLPTDASWWEKIFLDVSHM
ncbi:hypothetical protein Pelo_17347 [Pelomyxa schiedti]|nr:hypothetical protein Pelo_17347 [Pelomyxa schiedti]